MANAFATKATTINTLAKQNGSDWLMLASDTETRAYIERSGNKVRKRASYLKKLGDGWYPEDEETQQEINGLVDQIWALWYRLTDIFARQKKQKKAEDDKNELGGFANKQKALVDLLDSGSISMQDFVDGQRELVTGLLRATGRDDDNDDNDANDENENSDNNE